MLEKMNDFFDKRIESYDDHMKGCIEDFDGFYQQIVSDIDTDRTLNILVLGCGTGAEVSYLLKNTNKFKITCYDLSAEMLKAFEDKFSGLIEMNLKQESYFNIKDADTYDFVIAVMTMHHWTYDEKLEMYQKIFRALKDKGVYIEGDYYVTLEDESRYLKEREEKLEGVDPNEYYHIDIPFHHTTQRKLLEQVGFKGFERVYTQLEKEVHRVTCDKFTKI